MVPRKLKGAAEARTALAAAEASGLPRAAWAHAHGIDARSLNAWRLTLARRDRARAEAPLRLVELVAPCAAPEARYRVVLGDVVIEVDERFETETLRRLLAAVSGC